MAFTATLPPIREECFRLKNCNKLACSILLLCYGAPSRPQSYAAVGTIGGDAARACQICVSQSIPPFSRIANKPKCPKPCSISARVVVMSATPSQTLYSKDKHAMEVCELTHGFLPSYNNPNPRPSPSGCLPLVACQNPTWECHPWLDAGCIT